MDNVKATARPLAGVSTRKRAFQTFGAATIAALLSAFLAASSDARGRQNSYDLSLVPPPPPTPVLNIAPPPMVLPYSYAYQNYQPNVAATPRQEQLTRILSAGTSTSVPWPFSPVASSTAAPQSFSAIEAQIRGFGKPRQCISRASLPGGATAAPHVTAKPGNPWYESCFNWYLNHAEAAQRAISPPQLASGPYFQPPFPSSFQPPEPVPEVKSPVSGYVTKSSMASAHARLFRHRRRVIATR